MRPHLICRRLSGSGRAGGGVGGLQTVRAWFADQRCYIRACHASGQSPATIRDKLDDFATNTHVGRSLFDGRPPSHPRCCCCCCTIPDDASNVRRRSTHTALRTSEMTFAKIVMNCRTSQLTNRNTSSNIRSILCHLTSDQQCIDIQ